MKQRILGTVAVASLAVAGLSSCDDGGETASGAQRSLQDRLLSSTSADFAEQQRLIRDCMVRLGFEYTPVDNRASTNAAAGSDATPEEYAEEYGFGISTMFATAIEFQPAEDPNSAYLETLDDTQRKAYNVALYGNDLGGGSFSTAGGGSAGAIVSAGSEPEVDGIQAVQPGGCLGEALEATGGMPGGGLGSDLVDQLQDLEERIKSDPEMVTALKRWSQCMEQDGYSYRDPDQAQDELLREFADLTGLEIAGSGSTFFGSTASIGPDGAAEPLNPLGDVDQDKLADLQGREKRIAKASYQCTEEHVADVEQEVRDRYEEEFLADHPELSGE